MIVPAYKELIKSPKDARKRLQLLKTIRRKAPFVSSLLDTELTNLEMAFTLITKWETENLQETIVHVGNVTVEKTPEGWTVKAFCNVIPPAELN